MCTKEWRCQVLFTFWFKSPKGPTEVSIWTWRLSIIRANRYNGNTLYTWWAATMWVIGHQEPQIISYPPNLLSFYCLISFVSFTGVSNPFHRMILPACDNFISSIILFTLSYLFVIRVTEVAGTSFTPIKYWSRQQSSWLGLLPSSLSI